VSVISRLNGLVSIHGAKILNHKKILTAISALIALPLFSSCASIPEVGAADKDTTGVYHGLWIGSVSKPRANTAILPGNWTMKCGWEPFDMYLLVVDGTVQLGNLEKKTYISQEGNFRLQIESGPAGMIGGVISGTPEHIEVFAGKLSGENPEGKYFQRITGFNAEGCTGNIVFSRYQGGQN